MKLALNEVKTQAKKLLKNYSNELLSEKTQKSLQKLASEPSGEVKLKHCLQLISQQLGFTSWHCAQQVLSGEITVATEVNMGTCFYNNACGVFINQWFAHYDEAKQALSNSTETRWLLPYKQQFIVVEREYLTALNLTDEIAMLGASIEYDLYQGYNSTAWDEITYQVIRHRQNKM